MDDSLKQFADVALFLLSSTAELDSLVMAGFSNYTFTNLKIIYQFSNSRHWNDDGDQQLFPDSLLSNYQWVDSYNNPLYKSYLNAKLYKNPNETFQYRLSFYKTYFCIFLINFFSLLSEENTET